MVNIEEKGEHDMHTRILINGLFMIAMCFMANDAQAMDKIKEDALNSTGVNLYKIEHDVKEFSDNVADSISALKNLSMSITGNPNNYKMFLDTMDVPNVLNALQGHLFNIFEAYGIKNELVEKQVKSEYERAVKRAVKPNEQLIEDLKNIMSFEIEEADLHASHQKLKLVKISLEG
jgi:hypothetical protein